MSRLEEPAAVILAGDILRWVIPKVGEFPKHVRYGLGTRIESTRFDVFEELTRAQYARGGDRGRALELGNTRLQIVRHLARGKIQPCMTGSRARARTLPPSGYSVSARWTTPIPMSTSGSTSRTASDFTPFNSAGRPVLDELPSSDGLRAFLRS
jgi:hypothetical protein